MLTLLKLPVLAQTVGLLVPANLFMTFAWFDYLWAALCIMGAVYFIFRT